MSRSNPTDNSPNPSTRWFEWDGSKGEVRYYDKEAKKNVSVPDKFTFILLDQLGTIKGWHDASESGIYSNEVKDTRAEPFVVKAFQGGTLAEGIYKNIRDKVMAVGGYFVTNCYIAFRDGDELKIGSIKFKGAALRAWMEFQKQNRADLYKKAVVIDGSDEGKKGQIKFKTPIFFLKDIGEETDKQAIALDTELQEYLKGYFGRTKAEQAKPHDPADEPAGSPPPQEPDDDEIPF